MLNGVLVTFLAENQVFDWGPIEIGWLMGIPVLTGSLFRLPAGILTDKFGGKPVYGILLFLCAIPMFLLSYADSFISFALASFGFGLTGASFAIGIAFSSVWYPKSWQGTALGIFGAGNAGAALTTLFAPTLLNKLTDHGTNIEGWRTLPVIYAAALVVMGILFLLFTENKKPATHDKTLRGLLAPLKNIRVWRFGLYYFLLFGGFVSLAQWLIPYYVNVYVMSVTMAGLLASIFLLPSAVVRGVGGWLSDRFGARRLMYLTLGSLSILFILLIAPRMDIYSPGSGIMARKDGVVTRVSEEEIVVGEITYQLVPRRETSEIYYDDVLIFPTKEFSQQAAVEVGVSVQKKQLLARGVTHIYFQANVWIFTGFVFLAAIMMGIGMAAVYKHIPIYFPQEVGVVGGIVGVMGGLGGFLGPILFGYLLEITGIWTTCWMFFALLSLVSLVWMHRVIKKMMEKHVPKLMRQVEEPEQLNENR